MNLIVSQEKFEENRRNALIKDATVRNYMKQEKQRLIGLGIVFALIIIYFIGLLIAWNCKTTERARNNCLQQGYSMEYCLKNS